MIELGPDDEKETTSADEEETTTIDEKDAGVLLLSQYAVDIKVGDQYKMRNWTQYAEN